MEGLFLNNQSKMTKEYLSRWDTLVLKIGSRYIEFKPKRDGGSYFVTSDKSTIDALESNSKFNKDFKLFNTTNKEVVEKLEPIKPITNAENITPVEEITDIEEAVKKGELIEIRVVEEVVNITQAREYLREAGVIIQKLRTPKSIMKWANEMGIEFPNLKV